MVMLCLRDCIGEPVIKGEKTRKAFRRGELYDIDPSAPWSVHFKPVSDAEIAEIEANRIEGPPSKYLEPKVREVEADTLMDKFKIIA